MLMLLTIATTLHLTLVRIKPYNGLYLNMKYYSILTYLLKNISNDNIKFTSGNAASGTTLTTRSWSIKVLEFPTLVVQT